MQKEKFPTNPYVRRVKKHILPLFAIGVVSILFFATHDRHDHVMDVYLAMAALVIMGVGEILLLLKIKHQAPCPRCGQLLRRSRPDKTYMCPDCQVAWEVASRVQTSRSN